MQSEHITLTQVISCFFWPERGYLRKNVVLSLHEDNSHWSRQWTGYSLGLQVEAALMILLALKKNYTYFLWNQELPAINVNFGSWWIMEERGIFKWKYTIWKKGKDYFYSWDAVLNCLLMRIISYLQTGTRVIHLFIHSFIKTPYQMTTSSVSSGHEYLQAFN